MSGMTQRHTAWLRRTRLLLFSLTIIIIIISVTIVAGISFVLLWVPARRSAWWSFAIHCDDLALNSCTTSSSGNRRIVRSDLCHNKWKIIENCDNPFVIFNNGQGYGAYGGTQHSPTHAEMQIAWERKYLHNRRRCAVFSVSVPLKIIVKLIKKISELTKTSAETKSKLIAFEIVRLVFTLNVWMRSTDYSATKFWKQNRNNQKHFWTKDLAHGVWQLVTHHLFFLQWIASGWCESCCSRSAETDRAKTFRSTNMIQLCVGQLNPSFPSSISSHKILKFYSSRVHFLHSPSFISGHHAVVVVRVRGAACCRQLCRQNQLQIYSAVYLW